MITTAQLNPWFCRQELGIFEPDLPLIVSSLGRYNITERKMVGPFHLLDKEEDPPFKYTGYFKKVFFCVLTERGSFEFKVHIALRSDANAPSMKKELRVIELMKGSRGALLPLLIDVQSEHTYMISEIFNRGDLLTFSVSGEIPAESKSMHQIALSVVQAVAEFKKKGVVLRDIKAENVLVRKLDDGSYDSKLIDYGCSYIMGEDSFKESIAWVGTGRSIPLEDWVEMRRCGSPPQTGFSRDVWGLGVLLYEISQRTHFVVQKIKNNKVVGLKMTLDNGQFLGLYQDVVRDIVYEFPNQRPNVETVEARMAEIFRRTYPNPPATPPKVDSYQVADDYQIFDNESKDVESRGCLQRMYEVISKKWGS
jgi:serine/threonine protein kinase